MRRKYQISAFCLVFLFSSLPATADEGIWLFNAFPRQAVEKAYGFRVTGEFLNHLQQSAVRFNNGGTGSFVSASGLLFTNHHVGADCIQKLSTAQNDYMRDGFLAASQPDERRCPDLEVNVLRRIEDVTAKVEAAATPQTPPAEANRLRKAAMNSIEKACSASTGLRCDVVTLYAGGRYHLYQYKKYTDIRLVMAPEFGIAFFGGDEENFTFPRYDLDITFFRAYENGQPARIDQYFRWSRTGVKEGDLAFVPGNPGSTGRLMTVTELEFSRDVSYPLIHRRLQSLIAALETYRARGVAEERIGQENLFSQQNSFKAYTGFLSGLRDQALMDRKRAQEKKLKAAIAVNPAEAAKFGKFWDELSTTYAKYRTFYAPFWLLERAAGSGSALFQIARDIVRYSVETRKPDAERLREFAESGLPSLEQSMYSEAPIHPSMEIAVLADYFAFTEKQLGAGHPAVKAMLAGKTPQAAAQACVESSKLAGVAERRRLAADPAAVRASNDGMIRLALAIDPFARQLRQRYEDEVESIVTRAASQIAQARFAAFGGSEYPDATFTLRLSYGAVRGYRENSGKPVPFATTFAGLYPKGRNREPYIIPPSWLKAESRLNLQTPFDFVTTADTHGGNSGSATVNTKGEVAGILFDGNIESLPNRFVYTSRQARSVHVSSEAVIEALRHVYGATTLLRELGF